MRGDVFYDKWRRRWVYRAEPFTAEECESVASTLSPTDKWGEELMEAAERIRVMEAGDD